MNERPESINEESNDSGGLRTVIIHKSTTRTTKGSYGVTVSGESPVSVQDVKDGGPAHQAGIRKGDALIMVNDTPVSEMTHSDVVNIIKSTECVKLTLRHCRDLEQQPSFHDTSLRHSQKHADRVTAPIPVDSKLQNKLEHSKIMHLHKYLSQEKYTRENVLAELQKTSHQNVDIHKQLKKTLEACNSQIAKIQEEINKTEAQIPLQTHRSSTGSSHPLQHPIYQQHSRSSSDMPPPLPARNSKYLCTQMSAPNMSLSYHPNTTVPPPLPPRPPHLERDNAHSLENIHKVSNLVHSNSTGSESSCNRPQTHHRVKSSPDPLHGIQSSPGSNRLSESDSLGDLSNWPSKLTPSMITEDEPPGTPPPPYGSSTTLIPTDEHQGENYTPIMDETCSPTNLKENWPHNILTMEDEDGDICVEDHGPFQSLSKLISTKYNAYMAVFVNYVISNCDASSLFFYIITELYKDGGVKEMKKWAYEIHSSFLLPDAPMKLQNVDEKDLNEIDETLLRHLDKEEILRKVFWKARQRAREELHEQLADFRSKRSAGLGSFFGPSDVHLEKTTHNKVKEMAVVEEVLVPCLDSILEDLHTPTDHKIIKASSLATILSKYFNVKKPEAQQLIDKVPLFISKEKKNILKGNKKQSVRDHTFTLSTFNNVIHCNHCGNSIWGIAPQGYKCSDCAMIIHKYCVKNVEESCVGQRVERSRDTKLSSFISKIMPEDRIHQRKSTHINPTHIDRARRGFEDNDFFSPLLESEAIIGDKSGSSVNKEQRRSDPGGGGGPPLTNHHPANGGSLEEDGCAPLDENDQGNPDSSHSFSDNFSNNSKSHLHKKKSGTSINRSESCKEKQHIRKQARENRKNSDPNIPTSKSGDVDGDNTLNSHSGSSSSSSISQSQESPPGNCAEQVEAYASALDNDSDIEAEADLPDWMSRLSSQDLQELSSKDRKRQDTINEFFHTEQSHVRILKVLQFLFHQPLRQGGLVSPELLDRLFPNLDLILKFHTSFNKLMKKRRLDNTLVTHVGDIVANMFEGEDGSQFEQAACEFVACQGYALESLKQQQRRDQKLSQFLQDQENHPHCRRLQLKDMLPAGFQRLSKYPLLLESLSSYTDKNKMSEEYEQISRAVDRSKEILSNVNAAVHLADNQMRLREIQKKLDQSSLLKNKHVNCEELRGDLDLTKHKLVHEGPLSWKTSRQKNIDLHVLILEDCVVLLQKDNDKYILKYHSMSKTLGKDDTKLNLSPMIRFGTFLCREVATDKCGIFIILTQSTLSAQIYELATASSTERSIWLRHLHDAQANYNSREGRNRRPHTQPEPDESTPSTDLRDVEDTDENTEASDAPDAKENVGGVSESLNNSSSDAGPQAPSSPADTVAKKTELLRRKDLKIRQELDEKQNLIADILNIPREHFESVADMAGEVGLANKEPKELVLGAIYQAKRLQEALNEAQTIRDSDVMAAQAAHPGGTGSKPNILPLYQGPMEKLLNISGSLTQLLSSLMSLVSDRDEERERMRKELIASRERIHLLHMSQNETTTSSTEPPPTIISPRSSRPNSFLSVSSSTTEQTEITEQHKVLDQENKINERICLTKELQSSLEASSGTVESSSEKEETSRGESGSPNPMASEDGSNILAEEST